MLQLDKHDEWMMSVIDQYIEVTVRPLAARTCSIGWTCMSIGSKAKMRNMGEEEVRGLLGEESSPRDNDE